MNAMKLIRSMFVRDVRQSPRTTAADLREKCSHEIDAILSRPQRGMSAAEMAQIANAERFASDAVSNLRAREICADEVKTLVGRRADVLNGIEDGSMPEDDVLRYVHRLGSLGMNSIALEAERTNIIKRGDEL